MRRIDRFVLRLQRLFKLENGQDLVEYALVIALIALGVTASMRTLATGIGAAFTRISTQLSSSVS
jgi:pilus assembly protein Flp/PilA